MRVPEAPAAAATVALITHLPVAPGAIVTVEAGLTGPALIAWEATMAVVAWLSVHWPVCPTPIEPTDADAQNLVSEVMAEQVASGHAVHVCGEPVHFSIMQVA
jgi:hypothetical protein